MKKFLLFLTALLFPVYLFAGQVSFDQLTTENDVTINWLNGSLWTIFNAHNNAIETDNIRNGTIISDDMADSANPVVRDYELIGDYVYSGLLPATATGLTSDISAGTCYVNGNRIPKDATSHTYTASKDTWVYIDHIGTYQFKEVNNGDSQPTTDSNHIILAKVVTDGSDITTVTDYAQRTPQNMRIYTNFRANTWVSYDSSTSVNVVPGEIELGTTGKTRVNTSNLKLEFPTDLDTGAEAANTIYYVWLYPSTSNTTNYSGKISASSSDVTGITGERLIGWLWNDNSSNISPDCVGSYKGDGSASPNVAQYTISNDAASTANVFTAVPGMTLEFYSSGRPMEFKALIGALCNNGAMEWHTMFNLDGVDILPSETESDTGPSGGGNIQHVNEYVYRGLTPGHHTLKLRYKLESGGDLTIKYRRISANEL